MMTDFRSVKLKRRLQTSARRALLAVNPGALPDFIIAGAQKAGTTSLMSTLRSHPNIFGSIRKEVHYFDMYYPKANLKWYSANFPPMDLIKYFSSTRYVSGEASPSYLFFSFCAKRIAHHCPNMKIIVILRDPVHRAISHYFHNRRHFPEIEPLDIDSALEAEDDRIASLMEDDTKLTREEIMTVRRYSYFSRGLYAEQIIRYFEAFGREAVFVCDLEDLKTSESGILNDLQTFLRIPKRRLEFQTRNVGTRPSPIPDRVHERLRNRYRAPNERLFRILGRRYEHWM